MERVFEGDRKSEFSFGAERRSGPWRIGFEAVAGADLDLLFEARYRLDRRSEISSGYTRLDVRNLNGARSIPSLEEGDAYRNLYLAVAVIY